MLFIILISAFSIFSKIIAKQKNMIIIPFTLKPINYGLNYFPKKLKTYSNIGVNILMKINFLSEVVPYICYHKERYDGSGEPEGLKRMSIPLGSRIIAVADAYSAMTSDRSFRKAMSKEQALSIINQESGTKWDPIVVNALYEVV